MKSSKLPRVTACIVTVAFALAVASGGVVAGQEPVEDWEFDTGSPVWSSPTFADGTVYVGSYDNSVYAIDAETGSEKWSFETDGSVLSSPTVAGGTVYVGSNDNRVYAIDAETGNEEWSFETGNRVVSSPTVFGGTVYVGSIDDSMYALDAKTGEEDWSFKTGQWITSSPTVVGGKVYFGSLDGYMYALDSETGEKDWSRYTGFWLRSSPNVVGETVYISQTSASPDLYAMNASTGSIEWSYSTDTGFFEFVSDFVISSPTVSDGTVYLGSIDNHLHAVDAETGEREWRFKTDHLVRSSPVVADGTVFVGSHDFNIYAVDAENGDERWRFDTGDWVFSSPTVADGNVYVGSANGTVHALSTDVDEAVGSDSGSGSQEGVTSDGSRVIRRVLGHYGREAESDVESPVESVVFTQGGSLRGLSTDGGKVTDLQQENVEAIGHTGIDTDADGVSDTPFVRTGEEILLTDSEGGESSVETSAQPAKTSKTSMAAGEFGSGEELFYVATTGNGDEIYAASPTGELRRVANPENGVSAVSGTADIDGDGRKELVFADGSQAVRYVEKEDEVTQTFSKAYDGAGSNNNVGIGSPADFDGDGVASVPVVDGSNRILLVGDGGVRESLITGSDDEQAAKSPLAPTDIDGDGETEIVYIENNDSPAELKYIDDATGENEPKVLRGNTGSRIKADSTTGVMRVR